MQACSPRRRRRRRPERPIASAGWRFAVRVRNARISLFSELALPTWATSKERTSSSSSDLRIAITSACARLAAELAQIPVDVLFTIGTRATRIVAAAVKSTPVVTYSCDPFVHVSRLARPGGNVTGVTCMTSELMPKRLEILKELVPTTKRVTFLQDPEAATNAFELTQEAAKRLGVQLRSAEVTAAEELEPELAAIAKDRPDGLLVYPDMVLSSHPRPRQLGDFAIKAGIPTMHAFRFYVDAGGLISYGATSTEVYTNAAEQVAKILGGTQPGELPLRQATRFEMVINNQTAKALGITVPATLLARADEVIE